MRGRHFSIGLITTVTVIMQSSVYNVGVQNSPISHPQHSVSAGSAPQRPPVPDLSRPADHAASVE